MVSTLCSLRVFSLPRLPFAARIEVVIKSLEYGCYSYPCVYRSEKNTSGQGGFPRDVLAQLSERCCSW